MSQLTPRENVLVALGAAIASNCVPCVQRLVPQAQRSGLTPDELRAAVEQADRVRQVPAREVLEAALKLAAPAEGESARTEAAPRCGAAGQQRDMPACGPQRGCC